MSKVADALLLLAAILVVLTLSVGLALLLREFTSGAFGWNAATGAWVQAVLSVIAVVAAALISRSFARAIHQETLEREDRARERLIRRHLFAYEVRWLNLIDVLSEIDSSFENIRELLDTQPWGPEFEREQVERLHTAGSEASRAFGSTEQFTAAHTRLPQEILEHLPPSEWNALATAGNAFYRARKYFDEISSISNNYRPSIEECAEAAQILRAAHAELTETQRTIVKVFGRYGLMEGDRRNRALTTISGEYADY